MDERYAPESSPLIESNAPFLEDSFISPDPEVDEPGHGAILQREHGNDHHSTRDLLLGIDSQSNVENSFFKQHIVEGLNVEANTSSSSLRSDDTMEIKQACSKELFLKPEYKELEEALSGGMGPQQDVEQLEDVGVSHEEDQIITRSKPLMDEPLGLEFNDIEDSLFVQAQELSHQHIINAFVVHMQREISGEKHQAMDVEVTRDYCFLTYDEELALVTTNLEPMTSLDDMVTKFGFDPRRYRL